MVLAGHDLKHYLTPKFEESDLILSTSRALGSIHCARVHYIWSGVLLGRMNEFPLDVVTLFTMDAITDSDFPVDGVQRLRQSKKFLLPKYDFDFEQYIRLFDVNKIHSYLRELRMSLGFVKFYIK